LGNHCRDDRREGRLGDGGAARRAGFAAVDVKEPEDGAVEDLPGFGTACGVGLFGMPQVLPATGGDSWILMSDIGRAVGGTGSQRQPRTTARPGSPAAGIARGMIDV
jgi:hypothetical protein